MHFADQRSNSTPIAMRNPRSRLATPRRRSSRGLRRRTRPWSTRGGAPTTISGGGIVLRIGVRIRGLIIIIEGSMGIVEVEVGVEVARLGDTIGLVPVGDQVGFSGDMCCGSCLLTGFSWVLVLRGELHFVVLLYLHL